MSDWNWRGIRWRTRRTNKLIELLTDAIRTGWLRRKALHNKDERVRLEAARLLGDEIILRQMALEATEACIRSQAAELVQQEAFLSSIALLAWDIEQGRQVVHRIRNALLLRRVARSARQDAIRLAAAQKLNDPKELKKIARTTADISLRWEVARYLNDPELMADIALFKPGHARLDGLRRQARTALLDYLNSLERRQDVDGLLSFIWIQDHLPFKLQAFLRLPNLRIHGSVLQHLSRQDFSYVPSDLIQNLLSRIQSSGWHCSSGVRAFACVHCKGKGVLALKTISAAPYPGDSHKTSCPECDGKGRHTFFIVTCEDDGGHWVEFKLPPCADAPISEHPLEM